MALGSGLVLLQGLPWVGLLVAVASVVVLILVLALCTCKEKPSNESNNATLENIEKRKSRVSAEVKQDASLTDVQVDGEVTKRQSNGSVRNSNNSRPSIHKKASHDRALPEIPGVPGLSGEGDEEENDPNYDVIVKQKTTVAQRIQKEVAASVSKNHPYEKVKVVERQYEEVDSVKGKAEAGASANPEEEVYAGARSEGGSDYYASVNEYGIEYSKRDGTKEVIKTKAGSQESEEGEDTTYIPVPGPPVPKKNFEPLTVETGNSMSPPSPSALPQQSPELPPRNAMGQSMGSSTEAITSPGSSEAASTVVTTPGSPPAASSITNTGAAPAGKLNAEKKDPKYSKVTARESLQHMRDRVAQMEQSSTVQYDYIQYGDVKTVVTTGAPPMPQVMHRESMSSELYAEINTSGGSQRNSMYARVGDQKDPNAPAPPSVDILHHLSHNEPTEESSGEPPYSKISKQVPEPQVMRSRGDNQDPSQLYAQVAKDRKRSTIHVDSDVEGKVPNSASVDHMYAKVDKSKRSSGDSNTIIGASTSTSAPHGFGGARPKVTSSQSSDPVPGYATVRDSVPGYEQVVIQNGSPVIPDDIPDPGYSTVNPTANGPVLAENNPNYSTVRNGTGANSDYDPNYETVHMAEGEMGQTVELTGAAQWTRPVADPVYQEIPEVNKKQKPTKSKKHK